MAQIDNFIAMMNQQNVERAVLLSDKPAHLFSGGQDKPGPIIPGPKLQQVVQEILPPDLHAQLAAGQDVKFNYQSPHGAHQVVVHRVEGGLQVGLMPDTGVLPRPQRRPEQPRALPPSRPGLGVLPAWRQSMTKRLPPTKPFTLSKKSGRFGTWTTCFT